jgi:hypothetical protein
MPPDELGGGMSGNKLLSPQLPSMRAPPKKYQSYDWRQTMDQVGRELRKIYRQPKRLPRRLRVLVTELEDKLIKSDLRSREQQNSDERD